MQLVVELFAGLRERAGQAELLLEGLPEPLDVSALKAELEQRMPELGSLEHVTAVIGTEYVPLDRGLDEGERVALLPPVSGGEVTEADLAQGLFVLTAEPLDVAEAQATVEHESCGAVVVFTGNVRERNSGEDVTRLEYEALERMAGPEMSRIFAGVRADFGDPQGEDPEQALRMYCAHRIGVVEAQLQSLGGSIAWSDDKSRLVQGSADVARNKTASKFSDPSTVKNLPPKLSTCSLEAILTSVAKTIAPILLAVAIACSPATPAPTTKTFAAGTVPAAVIIIGIAFSKKAKDSITAL